MKAYKGFKRHGIRTLMCHNFIFEVGKTYTFDGAPILCKQGFHACHEPYQCWQFYPNNGENVYYEVECDGKIVESDVGDGKFVCTEITLVKEIPAPDNKFYDCWYFQEGYAKVKLNSKYNFINIEGKLLSDKRFDYCGDFHEGYAKVKLNGKYNFICGDGKLLSEKWFDYCEEFCNGYSVVYSKDKLNYINTEGQIISQQWFNECYSFKDEYAKVRLYGEWFKLDKNGKIME